MQLSLIFLQSLKHFEGLEGALDLYYWIMFTAVGMKIYYWSAVIMRLEKLTVGTMKMPVFCVSQVLLCMYGKKVMSRIL